MYLYEKINRYELKTILKEVRSRHFFIDLVDLNNIIVTTKYNNCN